MEKNICYFSSVIVASPKKSQTEFFPNIELRFTKFFQSSLNSLLIPFHCVESSRLNMLDSRLDKSAVFVLCIKYYIDMLPRYMNNAESRCAVTVSLSLPALSRLFYC